MKEPLAFDDFQDFIDYLIRTGIHKLQEAIVNRNIVSNWKKE